MTDSDRRRRPSDAPCPPGHDAPERQYDFYARAENQEPEGPPRRRSSTRREDPESLEETRAILEDQQTMADLAAAEAAIEAGDTVNAETRRAMIASRAKPPRLAERPERPAQ